MFVPSWLKRVAVNRPRNSRERQGLGCGRDSGAGLDVDVDVEPGGDVGMAFTLPGLRHALQ
jgi:hypothetical protein